jgi:hypothetical protein
MAKKIGNRQRRAKKEVRKRNEKQEQRINEKDRPSHKRATKK